MTKEHSGADTINKEERFIVNTYFQLQVFLFKNLLKNKIDRDPEFNYSSKIDDKIYASVLRKIIGDVDLTSQMQDFIELTNRSTDKLIAIFGHTNKHNLREISKDITREQIKKFAILELKRLKDVEAIDLAEAEEPISDAIKRDKERQANELLKNGRDGPIELNQDNFSFLIYKYCKIIDIAMKTRLMDLAEKGKNKLIKMRSEAYSDIGGLIDRNKETLEWLGKIELLSNLPLVVDIRKFIYELCHQGDIKTSQILVEKLGNNFNNFIKIISNPELEKYGKDHNEITIKKMLTIIEKRIKILTDNPQIKNSQRDIDKWTDLFQKISDAHKTASLVHSSDDLSFGPKTSLVSKSSSARQPSGSLQNVAKSSKRVSKQEDQESGMAKR